jgi:uncharacterized surface protein with fasciclin (FAS1) repeats
MPKKRFSPELIVTPLRLKRAFLEARVTIEVIQPAPVVVNNRNATDKRSFTLRKIFLGLTSATLVSLGSAPSFAADIVDTAIKAGQFKTLVVALKAAGLVDTLKGTGPFTVFAPTDAAFKKLPKGTVENLLKPENKAKLVQILTYHVVPGKIMSANLAGKKTDAKTVEGQMLAIDATMDGVTVNGAKIVSADSVADNGVIHVIDTVVIPKD